MLNIYYSGGYDIFLMKYDSTGSVLWTSQLGSTGADEGSGVAVSGDKFIYVTGYTGGSLNSQPNKGRWHCFYYLKFANLIITQVVLTSFW